MDFENLTEPQRKALLELALLAMYADGHLASAEDERIHELLTALGVTEESDRTWQYDTAIGRVSRHSQTAAAARAHVATLAGNFTTSEHRRVIYEWLERFVASDDEVVPPEGSYLALVREAFQS